MLIFCNHPILIHFCFIKIFKKFYRKANDNLNKKLWTQKKEELNWDKDQRNQRYMFINYFNLNVHSKVMHACMEVISWTATCMFMCWFGPHIIFWCLFKVHKYMYMQYIIFYYVSDILIIVAARGGHVCIQILFVSTNKFFNMYNNASV